VPYLVYPAELLTDSQPRGGERTETVASPFAEGCGSFDNWLIRGLIAANGERLAIKEFERMWRVHLQRAEVRIAGRYVVSV
jgi:hypothetical protein